MSNERLDDWKKQETAFNYARDRKLGPGLRRAALHAIHVSAVPHPDHQHDELPLLNLVHDPILADPNSPQSP